jgi:hypothetical protein
MKTPILPLLALAAALCGCPQENHASLEFFGICANPAPAATGCPYADTCGTYALFTYLYDPLVDSELLVPIEFFNQLPDNSDPSSGRVNTNDAVVQQWRFEYVFAGTVFATAAASDNFVVPVQSHKVAMVPVIPASLNTLMRGLTGIEIDVNVRAAGRYLDDRYFETGPFKVPAGTGIYVPPATCTAPAVLQACPQLGQSGTYACVTP